MSLFDSASVVITPSGYKEDKLYSIKPTDGSGDLVVTRATTATRVNSDGLIEVVPRNLFTYSNNFTNSAWSVIDGSVTPNAAISPSGLMDASRLDLGVLFYSQITQSVATIGTNKFSFYMRSLTGSQIIYMYAYNATDGVILSTPFTIGTDWTRISYTFNVSGSSFFGLRSEQAIAKSFYIYGAQVENSTIETKYFPTTDRLNVPRLDYTNSSCPSILVEPQRTNLCTYSEQFEDASYIKQNCTITSNSVVSPDGNNTADLWLDNTVNTQHRIDKTISGTGGVTYTLSAFFKAKEYDKVALRTGDGGLANFNILNGTIILVDAGVTAKIENYGNGWFRCSASQVKATTGTMTSRINILNASGSLNFAGTGTSGLYLWGAQLEAGSYATSYIPTIASSVTRNADVISKTGISSLIGQTEGTIFLDAVVTKDGAGYYPLGTLIGATSSIYIGINTFITSGNIYAEVRNTTQQALITSSVSSGRCKIALAYKSNDIALYINGNLIGTDTSATIPATSAFSFEYDVNIANRNKKNYNTVALWKERLSNETLATLTTI